MQRPILIFLALTVLSTPALASDTQPTAYDKEQLKQDYRAFLQQLKALNTQYKEVTGEISKVMKEEGTPAWDMGDSKTTKTEDEVKTQQQDLGGGVSLKDSEKDMQYVIDLPGYKKDSIKLSFQGNSKLVISASRKMEQMTRTYERTFDLPTAGDQKGITASYEDGVLTVKIPKIATKEVFIPVK